MKKLRLRTLLLLGPVGLALGGCAMEPPPGIEPPPSIEPPPDPPPAATGDLDAYLRSLPGWLEVSPPVDEIDAPVTEPIEGTELAPDGSEWLCTSTTYELARNPDDIAMASPDAAVIWPGALLRGDAHLERGAMELLAVQRQRRAPMGLSIQGGGVLGVRGGVSTVIEQPIGSTVREGINQLVANTLASDVATGAGASSFRSVETHSSEQALLELGFDARYLGASVEAAFEAERAVDEHTLTATFVQRLFTVTVDAPESPSDVFAEDVSAEDLRTLGVGPDNLPLYIDSVSYGRMLMVSITSTDSVERLEAAIAFAYDGVVADGSAYAEVELRESLSRATIEVFALGGPNAGVEALVASGQLGDYFDGAFAINQVEPISFTVRNLADNRVASVGSTTRYELERCEPVLAELPWPDHWWRFEGDLADTVGAANLIPQTLVDYGDGRYDAGAVLGRDMVRALDEQPISRTEAFTISAWIRPARDDAYMTVAGMVSSNVAAGDFQLRVLPGGGVQLFRRPAGGVSTMDTVRSPAGAAPAGRWTHVTAVYGIGPDEESALRLYVDGSPADLEPSPSNYSGLLFNPWDGFVVGTGEGVGGRWPYEGGVDEMMVFDRALSSDEVASHYARFGDYFD